MDWDALTLSRVQFALTIMFHYLFPPLSIGLGMLLVLMEGMFLRTRIQRYEEMARFWTRLFGVNFAMGVATGIVMEFQFGTNWSNYSRFVGDVFGSALAAEGIFAFFLESGFLAILVFGWDRVSSRMHFFATLMVSLGSIFSAVWIVVANSWQQTPAGFHLVGEGPTLRAEITDFWAMVLNPSSVNRLVHVLIGSAILGAFFVMSITAYYILRGRHLDFARRSFQIALVFGALASLAAPISGHSQGRIVAQTQPTKLAAFEGHFHTSEEGTPLYLFGFPDEDEERVKFGLAVPKLLSLLVHLDADQPVLALDQFPREDHPPVALSFHAYHAMTALGIFFLAVTLVGLAFLPRGRLFAQRWLLWIFVFAVLGAYAANQLGWVAAEVGRQPWTVYGLLRTSESVSPSVRAGEVLASILMFGVIYLMLFAVWVYVMNAKIQHGPDEVTEPPAKTTRNSLLEAAGRLFNWSRFSLSGVRRESGRRRDRDAGSEPRDRDPKRGGRDLNRGESDPGDQDQGPDVTD